MRRRFWDEVCVCVCVCVWVYASVGGVQGGRLCFYLWVVALLICKAFPVWLGN